MIEDDIYRTSTQYRYWSYTHEALASLRQSTNELAAERVRLAFGRSTWKAKGLKEEEEEEGEGEGEEGEEGNEGNEDETKRDQAMAREKTGLSQQPAREIDTLTVEEELKVIHWGCTKIIETGKVMHPPIPMEIRATAIQFLRRFYLTNSPMTYHPKQILTCALFLATKADHWHIPLSNFVDRIPGTEEKDVRAPEFLLMQGLRFTLDVRHPMRGLEGGVSEILKLVEDKTLSLDHADPKTRVGKAADRASRLLRGAAQMTDVYFLYTPSQVWFAALTAADPVLAGTYLSLKLAALGPVGEQLRAKLELIIRSCSEMLVGYQAEDEMGEAQRKEVKKEMKRIGRKLHLCQNPEKTDLVAVTKQKMAEKREGSESDRARVLKKRKLEREQLEQEGSVFGPSLESSKG